MCPRSSIPRFRAVLPALSVLGLQAVCAVNAWGRAGGGGGYSGGGGGGFSGGGGGFSGGGYSGGGGDVEPIVLVVFVLIFTVVTCLRGYLERKKSRHVEAFHWPSHTEHRRNVAKLQQHDSSFDFSGFALRVEKAFLQIQRAWSAQDLRPVQSYVSDSILERFSLQIQEQIHAGYRDHMPEIVVHLDRIQLASLNVTDHFETVDVCIPCTAVDYRVSLETGEPISGKSGAEPFVEFWSFLRRRGVISRPGSMGLIEGNCPNCAAELTLNQVGQCGSCQAVLRGGEHDWVLAEITQSAEWRPHDTTDLMAGYRASHDAGFTVQHAEDRGSVVFWRKAMADRSGSINHLRKMATDEFCSTYVDELRQTTLEKGRTFWHDCSVGSVDCMGVVSQDRADYLLLEIRWSGNQHRISADGTLTDLDNWKRLRTLFVLMRKKGVTSRLERILTSAHCPACGAPESDVTSDNCSYCHEVLNDGQQDWVLHELHPVYSPSARDWIKRLQPTTAVTSASSTAPNVPSSSEALAWLVQVVVADRTISEQEQHALNQFADRQGLARKELQSMMTMATRGELEMPVPANRETAHNWLTLVADMAVGDEMVAAGEEELLLELGEHVGFKKYDVRLLLSKRRAEHHRAKRRADRRQRSKPDGGAAASI